MIKCTVNGSTVNVESIRNITEGVAEKIKKNANKVKALEKDLHCSHILATTETGSLSSKIGFTVEPPFEPRVIAELAELKHQQFIEAIMENEPVNNEEDSEEKDLFFHIERVEKRWLVAGNIAPIQVVRLVAQLMKELMQQAR